jgi:hypothetical protein
VRAGHLITLARNGAPVGNNLITLLKKRCEMEAWLGEAVKIALVNPNRNSPSNTGKM